MSFFLSSAPFGALHPIYLICSGRMNRPGIKVLPAGKTLERRESAAPLCRAGEAVRAVRCVPGRTDRWSFAVIGMPRKSYLSSPDWFYRRGGRAPAVGRQRPYTYPRWAMILLPPALILVHPLVGVGDEGVQGGVAVLPAGTARADGQGVGLLAPPVELVHHAAEPIDQHGYVRRPFPLRHDEKFIPAVPGEKVLPLAAAAPPAAAPDRLRCAQICR